jgi:hypothetical protein
MPRKPTGNPAGRPKGSGTLGDDQVRLGLRVPSSLYERFAAYAEGRSFTRGTPDLSPLIRQAMEHFLACPDKRLTQSVPLAPNDNKRQTENVPLSVRDDTGLTENVLTPASSDTQEQEASIRQSESDASLVHEPVEVAIRQTASPPATLKPEPAVWTRVQDRDFDPAKYSLGSLCKYGHDWRGTGMSVKSLRRDKTCRECKLASNQAKRQAKRQTPQL